MGPGQGEHTDYTPGLLENYTVMFLWIRGGQESQLKGQVALGARSWQAVGCSPGEENPRDQSEIFTYTKTPAEGAL